ncbi:Uma2 family endonuclease [Tunicatimonas pelagia]|uniref:Uma2 family endonuclease n=1 Tax=Tunicatimonas pelagia TaxID=931531 RepID=UPI0026660FE8|nr:Uma2 family endonuclease [Tunicatimonas pelagia]WKN42905.1 Uma2 family endonuclease [Tunicatimonas pelagia]
MEVREVVTEETPVKIPEPLVYEVLDGQPIPYQGFREVLAGNKKLEDITGSSGLRSFIITNVLVRFLMRNLPEEEYDILSNEAGLHLGKNNNLATDIGIYPIGALTPDKLTNQYLDIPPQVAIEVDTKVEFSQFNSPQDYLHQKTQALLDFGTERVVWISTASKKVMTATAQEDWITHDWDKPVTLLPNVICPLAELLAKRGIK